MSRVLILCALLTLSHQALAARLGSLSYESHASNLVSALSRTSTYMTRSLKQSSPSSSNIPRACAFNNATPGFLSSFCAINTDFLTYLNEETNLTSLATPYGVSIVRRVASPRVCERYNVTSSEGRASCLADTSHGCFLALIGDGLSLGCISAIHILTAPGLYSCPGSQSYDRDVCLASNRSSCQANPNCIWSMRGAGINVTLYTPADVAVYLDRWRIDTGGLPIEYGHCQYRPEFVAATTFPNGTESRNYERQLAYDYQARTYFSNNMDEMIAFNGNCSGAMKTLRVNQYNSRCLSFNTMPIAAGLGNALLRSDMLINVTTLQGCIESRCALNVLYTEALGPNIRRFINASAYYLCNPDNGYAASLVYDPEDDGPVYNAYVGCNSFSSQFDRDTCLGIPNGLEDY